MTRLFSNLKRIVHQTLILTALVSLISVFSVSVGVLPSVASHLGSDADQQQVKASEQTPASRAEAYEKEVDILQDPNGLEKEYEENLAEYRESHPNENGLLEEAKELVEKVTGNE